MKRLLAVSLCVFLAAGCASSIILLDRPDYHYQNGLKLLNQGNVKGAETEFEYAVFLDERYIPAHVGLAIAYGTIGDLEKALEHMKKAQSLRREATERQP